MVIEVRFQIAFVVFWIASSALALVAASYRASEYWKRRNRAKRERMFVELRSQGYNICDVNSNATRAKLSYMDPLTEQPVWEWVDIVEFGRGYGLADPINSERN